MQYTHGKAAAVQLYDRLSFARSGLTLCLVFLAPTHALKQQVIEVLAVDHHANLVPIIYHTSVICHSSHAAATFLASGTVFDTRLAQCMSSA